jgi:hypothetical protein
MNVSATISRRDIFLVSLLALPRVRSNWYVMAVFGTAAFVFLMRKIPVSATTVLLALLLSIFSAVGALLGGFLANSAGLLLRLEKNSGVLGTHEFSLSPTQLQETTDFNDSRYAWTGIHSIETLGSYIVVRINRYAIYVIPRRSFSSGDEFKAFFNQATAWKQAAEKSIEA